jgi:serine/threonine protein phosphatase PrpC
MKTHPDRNKITNCLGGVEDMFYIEVAPVVQVRDNDTLLLCSDGFWSPLAEVELAALCAAPSLQSALSEMVDVAVLREGGSADNTTAVAARLGADEPENETDIPVCMVLDERSAVA